MTLRKSSQSMRLLGATIAMLAMGTGPLWAADVQNEPVDALRPAPAAQLADYAQAGRFSALLAQLKQGYSDIDRPAVKNLITELEHFQSTQAKRAKVQLKDYGKALAEVAEALKKGNTEQSLIEALDARDLATNRKALLNNPEIVKATAEAAKAAEQAQTDRNWVRALSLYRLLDDLHKVAATYHNDAKNAAHHVHVLQVYVPGELAAQYRKEEAALAKQRKEAKGPGAAQAIELDHEPWQTRLEGIQFTMFKEALHRGATQHVDAKGYQPMMLGAVDELALMVDTPQLTSVFLGLANAAARRKFEHYLDGLEQQLKSETRLDQGQSIAMFNELRTVNRKTVKLPSRVLAYELTEGATNTLDRFSRVIWPSELRQFSRTTHGTFYGVGIQISEREGRLTVISPLVDTPAARAGVIAGDVIAQVNGKKTTGWSLGHAIRQITGPQGTRVTLGLRRAGRKHLIKVTVKRAKIAIRSILGWQRTRDGRWNYWIDPYDRIGYIRLTQFLPQTADDLDKAVSRMQASGPIHGLILDLRFNPGGLLTSAAAVADRFITHGPIVFTVEAHHRRGRNNNGYTLQVSHRNAVLRAHQAKTYARFPVVVLINGDTASAAEIVTGALQDYARAEIVGVRSYGKGSVQDLFPIDNDRAFFKLTRQYYMLPLGRIIHRFPGSRKWGIDPDLKVPMTPKQIADAMKLRQQADVLTVGETAGQYAKTPKASEILQQGIDPQLETALLVLQTKLVAHHIAMAERPIAVNTP